MTGKVAPDQMARKAQAVAYWLLPETAARAVLSREIRVQARRFGAPLFEPHLSLLYAKLPPETKQRLADKIRLPFREVCFTSICAMRCARPTTTASEVERWKLLAP